VCGIFHDLIRVKIKNTKLFNIKFESELIDLDDGTVSSPSKPRQPEPNPFTGLFKFYVKYLNIS